MTNAVRQTGEMDLPLLLTLMSVFYAEAGYPLNLDRARAAFLPLLGPGELGQVLLSEVGGEAAGHPARSAEVGHRASIPKERVILAGRG